MAEYEASGGQKANTLLDTGLPIIVVTTRGESQSREAGFANGCSDFVTKPLNSVELLSKLRNFLGE